MAVDVNRCLVGDAHPIMREAIARALASAGGRVVGQATSAGEALRLIADLRPEVAVLDAPRLGLAGDDLVAACAGTRVVIFTGLDGDWRPGDDVAAGAAAFVSKSRPLATLVEAVEVVARGEPWVDPIAAPRLVAGAKVLAALTVREREVLELVADGRSYEEIGAALGITVSTVQHHVTSAMNRLEADTRTQAVATALRLCLIA